MVYRIAIVGATGVVGRTALQIMKERNLLENDIHLFASKKSAGNKIRISNRKFVVKRLCDELVGQFDFALFCTKEDVSKEYVPKFVKQGACVIDFSSYYRKRFPLIVPEINAEKAKGRIICNPNCSTIAAVMALYNIHRKFGLESVIYSTYQAVSGAGQRALKDLYQKRVRKLHGLPQPIYNNVIPFIGKIASDGYSKEEHKMMYETRKILGDKNIKVTATCVRVPVDIGHSESINFTTKKKCRTRDVEALLKETPGVCYKNDFPNFPMPKDVKGQDNVFVGRVRKDFGKASTINMFVVSDNLRKGAAQNGVQILELMIERRRKDGNL